MVTVRWWTLVVFTMLFAIQVSGCGTETCNPACDGLECGYDGCGGLCGTCTGEGYCGSGICYDCAEEGLCRATSCPDDGNPCTQEMLDPNGKCVVILSLACQEAIADLQKLYRGAQGYYGTWFFEGDKWYPQPVTYGIHLPLVQEITPSEGSCCWHQGGPDKDGDNLCDNHAEDGIFMTPVWRFLDFDKVGPHRFSYEFEEVGDGTPGETMFEARVIGDLDCDGKPGTFVVKGVFGPSAVSEYLPDGWEVNPHNKLALPPLVQFYLEDKGAAVATISSTWPAPTSPQLLSSVFMIGVEDTYVVRMREAFVSFLRMDAGAQTYFSTPVTAVEAPACRVAVADEEKIETWAEHLWDYYHLHDSLTPVSGNCCLGKGADGDGDNRCDPDPQAWADHTWMALQFDLEGSHEWIYAFLEAAPEGGAIGYRARAYRAIHCDGFFSEQLAMLGEVSTEEDCQAVRNPIFEYMPFSKGFEGEPSLGIRIAEGDQLYALLQDGIHVGGGLGSPLPYEETHAEAFLYSGDIMEAITAYWQSNCSLPPYPGETPAAVNCCDSDVDANQDTYCDANVSAWNHEFWTAIGFKIDGVHRYRFYVSQSAVEGDQLLIKVVALGNWQGCGIGDHASFYFYGVATNDSGSCTMDWFESYNTSMP
jgi:hypothetical protein